MVMGNWFLVAAAVVAYALLVRDLVREQRDR
jgi:hypothetical protein